MRSEFDLSHPIAQVGGMGHLQTLSRIPVIAGDSIGFKLTGKLRLSPLRRHVILDPQVDLTAFWVPHRHVYGEQWVNFIKDGVDASLQLPGTARGTKHPYYLGLSPYAIQTQTELPKWCQVGYNQIWNRYFRVPTDHASVKADGYMPDWSDDPESNDWALSNYGLMCARLKTILSTPIYTQVDAVDRRLELKAPSALTGATHQVLDLNALAVQKARYRSEQEREWFYQRYADLLPGTWPGGHASTDADERPTMLNRQSFTLAGFDQGGQDDATLGTFVGTSEARINFTIPNWLCPEHGTVWILALLRYPALYFSEGHFLEYKVSPTYSQVAGEHGIVAAQAPKQYNTAEFFGTPSSHSIGLAPYGEWYRYHPPSIHNLFQDREGFPFLTGSQHTKDSLHYCQPNEYKHVFATRQQGEWEYTGNLECRVMRALPGGITSIFAGADA